MLDHAELRTPAVPGLPDDLSPADVVMSATPGVDHGADATPEAVRRRLVLVAGSGRSGTSLMAGILRQVGLHVPQPEVPADHTNPKGFAEPQWAVDFHDLLLRRVNVQVGDARPAAWFETGRAGSREANRAELTDWLGAEFAQAETLVVKDPRIAWFLGMWRVAALRCGAETAVVTMIRHPAEVVASKGTYYGGRLGDIHRLAGWTNLMLFTERASRHTPRAFVRYDDLLTDWTRTVTGVGDLLDLSEIKHASTQRMQEIHDFVDPDLRRVRRTWDDLDVPAPLREIADATWTELNLLAEGGNDVAATHARLDDLRTAYAALYSEAEALAAASIEAAGPAFLRATRAARATAAEAAAQAAYEAASPSRKVYLRTRRVAGRARRRWHERRALRAELAVGR